MHCVGGQSPKKRGPEGKDFLVRTVTAYNLRKEVKFLCDFFCHLNNANITPMTIGKNGFIVFSLFFIVCQMYVLESNVD